MAEATRRRRTVPNDTPPKENPKAATNPRPRKGSLQARLEQFFASFSLPFAAMGDQHCATIIAGGAPQLAESWTQLAEESPAVKRALEGLLQGGAWSGVIFSTLAIAVPVLQHHNIVPELPWEKPQSVSGAPEANGSSPHGPNIPQSPPPTGTVQTAGADAE